MVVVKQPLHQLMRDTLVVDEIWSSCSSKAPILFTRKGTPGGRCEAAFTSIEVLGRDILAADGDPLAVVINVHMHLVYSWLQ